MSRNLYPKKNSYIKERGTIIMTKIKNTKKGMAKKTLSISLVAAMLATSNVPVWADEFSDGTDAAFTSEAAAPQEVTAPEAAAPEVQAEEAPVSAKADASSLVYDDTKLASFKLATAATPDYPVNGEWGTKIKLPENAIKFTDTTILKDGNARIIAYCMKNGLQISGSEVSNPLDDVTDAESTFTQISEKFGTPTIEDCINGTEYGLRVQILVNGDINFDNTYNFGAPREVDLTDWFKNPSQDSASKVKFKGATYNNKDQKPVPEYVSGATNVCVGRNGEDIGINDFNWDYVRTIESTGENDLKNSEKKVGQQINVIAKVVKPGYTGSFTKKNAYTIRPKSIEDNAGDFEVKTNKTFEFTGGWFTATPSDFTVKDTETGDELAPFIETADNGNIVKADGTNSANGWTGKHSVTLTFDTSKDGAIKNYKTNNTGLTAEYEVVKRDLSKCSVELVGDYTAGELDDKISKEESFNWGTELKLYDKDHNDITNSNLYDLLTNKVSKENGKYYITVTPMNSDDAKANVINSLKQEVASPTSSLRNCKVYFEDATTGATASNRENKREFSEVLKDGISYTGEPYVITKSDIYVRDYQTQDDRRLSENTFDIECDPTTGVGEHWIKIIGKGDYAGSTLKLTYEVNPASVKNVTTEKEVVINPSYTKASDYAKDIDLKVIAENTAMRDNVFTKKNEKTTQKTFNLTSDDMELKYSFVTKKFGSDLGKNTGHNWIKVEGKVTNPNYQGEKTKNNFTEYVEIVHPSIANAHVEILPGDYTFTGEKVIPKVKVTAEDGTVLKEGVDYRLDVKNGLHAGKAEAVITAIKDCKGLTDAYEKDSINEGNFFTINPADINAVKAAIGEVTYNGTERTPAVGTLYLGKADVTSLFDTTTPTYTDNVNAGTAKVTVPVKEIWAHDFTDTKLTAEFKINPFTITESGEFLVYGQNGHIITFNGFEGFTYDGTAKTFKAAKYNPEPITLNRKTYTLEEGKDYTIEYADNIYPDKTGKDGTTSHIFVKLSDNFKPAEDKDESFTDQSGNKVTNVIADKKFRITKASLANAAVSVENPVYDGGSKVLPTVKVTVDGKTLEENKDYVLKFAQDETFDATESDNKTVIVEGINGYVGSSKEVKWGVNKKAIDSEDIKVELDKTSYKPGEKPQVTLIVGKTILDTDEYTVAYTDTEKGILTISGAKNYTGDKTVEYEVAERSDLADATIKGVPESVFVTGEAIKPEIKVVYGNKILTEGTDYTVTYGENTEVGEGTVTITAVEGSVDYKGTQTVTFQIKDYDRVDLAEAKITGVPESVFVTGEAIKPEIEVVYGTKILTEGTDYTVTYGENTEVGEGTVTITAVEGSKEYTGTQTVTFQIVENKPAAPELERVDVYGNTATAVLSGEVEDADGYDYVIGTDEDCIVTKDYVKVNKNILKTETPFTYVQTGTYYAYCHAWKRVDGKKVFSDWSKAVEFEVKAVTPAQPVITNVTVKGSTVTVTYTKAEDADGYDVVLGSAVKPVNGEKRPVNYGTLVKKNIKGNTVTATFKNVPEGTYYAGLHAFNRTAEDGKKVFSPWSNTKKVTVK